MLLLRYRALEKPSPSLRTRDKEDDDSDDGFEDDIGMVNTKSAGIRSGGAGLGVGSAGARGNKADSDDSDFDM